MAARDPDSCSPWILDELRELSSSRGLGRTVHLAQSDTEMAQVKEMTDGRTSTEYLDDHGWLGPDLLAAHCYWCTPTDVDLLARNGVSMAHCAATSSRRGYNRLGYIPALLDAGVNVTLGTDNMSEDMFEAMRIAIIKRWSRLSEQRCPV